MNLAMNMVPELLVLLFLSV